MSHLCGTHIPNETYSSRREAKCVNGLANKNYEERHALLKIDTLGKRWTFFDLVEVFKILVGVSTTDFDKMFMFHSSVSHTRGHRFKLFKNQVIHDFQKHCFSNRVIDIWNNLPNDVVESISVTQFKRKLQKSMSLSS